MKVSSKDYKRWQKLAYVVTEYKDCAQDILQEVMMEVMKKCSNDPSFIITDNYIFISVKNRYMNFIKKDNKRRDKFVSLKRTEDGDNYEDTVETLENPIEDEEEYDYERDVEEKLKVELIEKVSLGLNYFDKQLFILHYVQKIPQRKISRDTDITMGVIHQRLAKIKKRIQAEYNNLNNI